MKVCIIGAGAAGMLAAINAASEKNEVFILEHMSKCGSKIRVSGNGKCNLTNKLVSKEKYNNQDFADIVLNEFSVEDTKKIFYNCGLMLKEKNGYYYPMSEQAASVIDVLQSELYKKNIKLITDFNIKTIHKKEDKFIIEGNEKIIADKLIIATGGMSASKTGSDGSGYDYAKKFGHKIIEPVPGLTGIVCNNKVCKSFAGVRTKASITSYVEGIMVYKETGEVQFTDYGLSGIPIFNCCNYISKSLYQKEDVKIIVDFLPDINVEDIENFIAVQKNNGKSVLYALKGMLPSKIANGVYEIIVNKCKKDSEDFIPTIIKSIKEFEFDAKETRDFEQAQVTCGGVDLTEINPKTMESKLVENLYFAGEVVDINGLCGGYNLQFAWSSGAIAGKSCLYDKN